MPYFYLHKCMRAVYRLSLRCLVILCFSLVVSPAHAVRPSYFSDLRETENNSLDPFPKWTTMYSRFADQETWPEEQCDKKKFFPCRVKEWKSVLDQQRGGPLSTALAQVNRYINKYPYVLDQVNWGMLDYWATPFELISVNGDCEDYAIAKYYSLRYLGLSPDRMRIIIVQDFNLGGIIHAILGVYDDNNDLMILDNQIKQVVPANRVYHYRPIYGINENAWWAYHVQ